MLNSFQRKLTEFQKFNLIAGIAFFILLLFSYPAFGYQDEENNGQPENKPAAKIQRVEDQKGENKADEKPADDEVKEQNFLSWMVEASGIFGLILLIISIIMVALISTNLFQIRRESLMPSEYIELFEEKLKRQDYQGAYEISQTDDSFLARILAAGLSRAGRNSKEALAAMQETGEYECAALENKLSYLKLIGAIAPMIGLMGTVYGMIESFEIIANSRVQPKPSDLAGGISTALFTTLEGLSVAIPAVVFYTLLRNRLSIYIMEAGIISESLMNKIITSPRKTSKPSQSGDQPERLK